MSQNFTLEQLEIIAECIRVAASSMLLKGKLSDLDKVRILTVGVVLDEVTKEIERAKTIAVPHVGDAPVSEPAPDPDPR